MALLGGRVFAEAVTRGRPDAPRLVSLQRKGNLDTICDMRREAGEQTRGGDGHRHADMPGREAPGGASWAAAVAALRHLDFGRLGSRAVRRHFVAEGPGLVAFRYRSHRQ